MRHSDSFSDAMIRESSRTQPTGALFAEFLGPTKRASLKINIASASLQDLEELGKSYVSFLGGDFEYFLFPSLSGEMI